MGTVKIEMWINPEDEIGSQVKLLMYKYSTKNYQQNKNSLYILEDEMDIPENMDSHC